MDIALIIPAFEPDERLIGLLEELKERGLGPTIVVDDGSGPPYSRVFEQVEPLVEPLGGELVSYPDNRGKGAALKVAFARALEAWPGLVGVVTADSDGQHTPDCIERVREELLHRPDALVLGERSFSGEGVPTRSKAGNRVTALVFGALFGLGVSDTQTGLRGIPADLMRRCLTLTGDRFEFEMQMLALARDLCPVVGVPIETIYESKTEHRSHYRTVQDSLRIARVLVREPVKGGAASLATEAAELCLFAAARRALGASPVATLGAAALSRALGEAAAPVLAAGAGNTTKPDAGAGLARAVAGTLGTACLERALGGHALASKAAADAAVFVADRACRRLADAALAGKPCQDA